MLFKTKIEIMGGGWTDYIENLPTYKIVELLMK